MAWAHYYRSSYGFNVTCILPYKNRWNYYDNNYFKAPSHKWEHLQYEKQTLKELYSYDWANAVGIGVVLGYDDLRCIDIDGINNENYQTGNYPEFEQSFLDTRTPNGCHFYFRSKMHEFNLDYGETKTFNSKGLNDSFKSVELRYRFHSVLPPSMNKDYKYYEKAWQKNADDPNRSIPVENETVYRFLEYCCNIKNDFLIEDLNPVSSYSPNTKIQIKDSKVNKIDSKKLGTIVILDTETTGLIKNTNIESIQYPRLLQLSLQIFNIDGILINNYDDYIRIDKNIEIEEEAFRMHGIDHSFLEKQKSTTKISTCLDQLIYHLRKAKIIVGHNIQFDISILENELKLQKLISPFKDKKIIDTMKIDYSKSEVYFTKWPKLHELYNKLFTDNLKPEHNAILDTEITTKCFWELVKRNILNLEKYYEI